VGEDELRDDGWKGIVDSLGDEIIGRREGRS
jgi:hypothetical protein